MPLNIIRKVNTYIGYPNMKFGDFILFQEYNHVEYNHTLYDVSKPKLVIYLGYFIADQTIGFNYIEWINENKPIRITNKYVTNFKSYEQVGKVESHIEWDGFIDILGHWQHRPPYRELMESYRKGIMGGTANISYIEHHPHLIYVGLKLNSDKNVQGSDTTEAQSELLATAPKSTNGGEKKEEGR